MSIASGLAGAASALVGGGGAASPSVRKPIAKLTFGSPASGGGAGGLLGAAASAASSLLGGGSSNDPFADAPISVRADLGLAPHVDVVDVAFLAARGPSAAIGDDATLALGYADADTPDVFKGKLAAERTGTDGMRRLILWNASADLAALRLNVSFENQSAGDVAGHIAGEASVDKGRVEAGPDLAFYAVDDRLGAYAHLAELALQAGLVARINAEGKLELLPLDDGASVQTFTWAQDVISASLRAAAATPGKRSVVGEGAAGSQGSDAWSWLVKDPSSVKSTAGDGAGERIVPRPGLRSNDAVSGAAAALKANIARGTARLRLVVPGAALLLPASVFEVAGAPDGALNAQWAAVRVRHSLTKRDGFRSMIDAVKAGAGGGAGGGLLGAIGGLL